MVSSICGARRAPGALPRSLRESRRIHVSMARSPPLKASPLQEESSMSVSAVGSPQVMPMTPERAEGPGPDHDGDSDDKGGASAASVQPTAPTANGTGLTVNKVA